MDDSAVKAWIAVADRDLTIIRKAIAGPDPEPAGAAFHCQQAAEKLVKAVLVASGINPPKSHDIDLLIKRLPSGHSLHDRLVPSTRFTDLVATYRYPAPTLFDDPPDDPTVEEVAGWLAEEIEALRADILHFLGFAS